MKKIFLGVGIILVALIGAIFIVPSYIDWNDYKPEIAAQAKKATGRDLIIEGDIRIAVLPAPALVAHNVRFTNAKGAADPDMVRLKSVEVRMAVQPLLAGKIQFETIKLIEPIISLEVLADGRKNWDIQAQENSAPAAPAKKSGGPSAKKPGSGVSLSLDNVIIQNGSITYRDSQKKSVERVDNINVRVAVASLSGPFEVSGSLLAKGLPLKIIASLGKIIEGRTVPINTSFEIADGAAKIQALGYLKNLAEFPTAKVNVIGEGKSLASLIHVLAKTGALPGSMGQPFRIEGEVVASAASSSISKLVIQLGETQAKGAISLTTDKKTKLPNIIAKLAISKVNLDKMLALPEVKPAPKTRNKKQSWLSIGNAFAASPATQNRLKDAKSSAASAALIPTDLVASLNIVLDRLIYRNQDVRQAKANIEIANGEITISQVSAQLPGPTDVALFGFLTAKNGTPRFEGEIEAAASDVRRVARWLDIALPQVPSDRLRRVTFAGKFSATPKKIDVAGLDMQFDSSRLTGAATVALRQPIAFGANLVLDRLNLDAYLKSQKKPGKPGASKKPIAQNGLGKASTKTLKPAPNPLAALSILKAFDANVKAHVRTLVYQGTQIKDIVLDGTLFDNTLDIRRASIAKFSGASFNLKGKVEKLVSLPSLKNVRATFNIPNIGRLFRAAGLETPPVLQKIGKVTMTSEVSGSIFKPKLKTRIQAAGADITVGGTVSALPVVGGIDLALRATHNNLPRLLRAMKIDYRPSKRLGKFDLAAAITGDVTAMTFQRIKIKLGKLLVDGHASINLKGARPILDAKLATSALNINPFLPAKRRASLDTRRASMETHRFTQEIQAAWRAPSFSGLNRSLLQRVARRTNQSQSRWSSDPIDLSGLRSLDATVSLTAPSVKFDQYRLDKADIALILSNGVLRTNRLTGMLFGGTLQGQATVNASKSTSKSTSTSVNVALTIKNANVSRFEKALSRGSASFDVKLNTTGASVYQMVSRLNGTGNFVLQGLDVKARGQGSALAGILNLVVGLNQFGGQLGGSRKGKGLADSTGTFTIDKGIARTQDIKLLSSVGNGDAKGFIHLPRWYLDVNGQVKLAQNVLTSLLQRGKKSKTVLPFRVYGRLDKPNVKLDTSKIKGGIPIPGLGNIIKKQPGVGKLLDRLIPGSGGGSTQQQPQTQPQTQQPAQPQQKKKISPEDILKGLFGIK